MILAMGITVVAGAIVAFKFTAINIWGHRLAPGKEMTWREA